VPEILEIRYGSTARTISAICIIIAYVGIASNQFKGCGYIISLATGIDINGATLLSAIVITFLSASGGMYAIAYSDFVSALLMVIGFMIAIPFAVHSVGGFNSMIAQLPAEKATITGGLTWPQMLGYILPSFFLILGDQNMYQRFGSAKDAETAKKSNIGFFISEVLVCVLTILLVTVGIVLVPNLEQADTIVFVMAMEYLPFVIGGIVIATSVAFMITTGDSFLLSASTNVIEDIWARFSKKDATDQKELKYTRWTIAILAAVAYIFGMYFPSILKMQNYAYTMYGAAITPALLAALTWKRANKYGGLASIIVGGGMTILWDVVLKQPMDLNSSFISVPAAIITLVVVSLLTPEPKKETLIRIFGENN
jgi:SSS family solute:Na+ symporter